MLRQFIFLKLFSNQCVRKRSKGFKASSDLQFWLWPLCQNSCTAQHCSWVLGWNKDQGVTKTIFWGTWISNSKIHVDLIGLQLFDVLLWNTVLECTQTESKGPPNNAIIRVLSYTLTPYINNGRKESSVWFSPLPFPSPSGVITDDVCHWLVKHSKEGVRERHTYRIHIVWVMWILCGFIL